MTEPLQLPRYAIGTLSPVGGIDTMPYGMYRLLGPDFIVISVSLALMASAPALLGAVGCIFSTYRCLQQLSSKPKEPYI